MCGECLTRIYHLEPPQPRGEISGSPNADDVVRFCCCLTKSKPKADLILRARGFYSDFGSLLVRNLSILSPAPHTSQSGRRRTMTRKTLLTNGVVVIHGADDEARTIKADVLIEDDRITQITPDTKIENDVKVIDCTDKIIAPGFIDTHRHMYNTVLRGRHGNDVLPDYIVKGNRQLYQRQQDGRDVDGLSIQESCKAVHSIRQRYSGASSLGALKASIMAQLPLLTTPTSITPKTAVCQSVS